MKKLMIGEAVAASLFAAMPTFAVNLPASGAFTGDPQFEACVFRDYLLAARQSIVPMPTGSDWLNVLVELWDYVAPDWLKNKDRVLAEAHYKANMHAVASEGEAWFDMPYRETTDMLDVSKDPDTLRGAIDSIIKFKTQGCRR